MVTLTPEKQADNLRQFFATGVNSVTRERIFFDRLSFDLKIAAARAGYHLHLYEPDVDRDGFDIVVEDQDEGMGWFQLKSVLRSAGTGKWEIPAGFLAPGLEAGDAFWFDPPECGRGGGVILIEIDDTLAHGDVVYSYTDFRILTALADRFLVEVQRPKSKGRPPITRQSAAEKVIAEIRKHQRNCKRKEKVAIPRSVFVELKEPDGMLALMALQNSSDYGAYCVAQACRDRVTVHATGTGQAINLQARGPLAILHFHMEELVQLLSVQAGLRAFKFPGGAPSHASPS